MLRAALHRYGLVKPPEDVIAEANDPSRSLKKSLGSLDLVILGVGAIIGAGIFVLAGTGAARAGPLVIFGFVLAGIICALAGLAYAELASTIPTSGSAYAYAYSSLGEAIAWTLGWALVLEYAVGSATVAIGWSANFTALLDSAGIVLPPALRASPEIFSGVPGGFVNLPAIAIVAAVAVLLVVGSKLTARFASVFVIAKVGILVLVIGVGMFFISGGNLTLSPPAVPGGEWYSILGTAGLAVGAAAVIFFAYIGFDAVSTTAEEAKDPKRDLPIGIMGSLAICTVLYILASIVLVGMTPYTAFLPDCTMVLQQGDPCAVGNGVSPAQVTERIGEPFGYAFESAGMLWAATLIRVGAIIGITSVLMVLLMGGPRVFFALARDGLLPRSWSKVSRFGTPARTTIGTAVGVCLFAGFGTLGIAANLTNIGTAFAFALVCVGVIVLRYKKPGLHRPFRVPLNVGKFPILAGLGAVLCFGLMLSTGRATLLGFFAWMGLGLVIYSIYGIRKSKLFGHVGREGRPLPDGDAEIVLEEVKPSP